MPPKLLQGAVLSGLDQLLAACLAGLLLAARDSLSSVFCKVEHFAHLICNTFFLKYGMLTLHQKTLPVVVNTTTSTTGSAMFL